MTTRLKPLDRSRAQGRARELLDELSPRSAEPAPMVRTMANAPALLRGYLDLSRAMKCSAATGGRRRANVVDSPRERPLAGPSPAKPTESPTTCLAGETVRTQALNRTIGFA